MKPTRAVISKRRLVGICCISGSILLAGLLLLVVNLYVLPSKMILGTILFCAVLFIVGVWKHYTGITKVCYMENR